MSVMTIRAHKRYAMRLPVQLARKGRKTGAKGLLIELSSKGARISNLGNATYEYGEEVVLGMCDGRELRGTIRWAHDGLAGVTLDSPLHAPQMAEFLEASQRSKAARDLRYGT